MKKFISMVLLVLLVSSMLTIHTIPAAKKEYLTRAQAVAVLNRRLGVENYSSKQMAGVKDCKSSHKAYKTMARAVSAGLISPDKKGKLYPDKKANYQYVSSILAKTMYVKTSSVLGKHKKKDKLTAKNLKSFFRESFPTIVTRSKSKVAKGNVLLTRPGLTLKNCSIDRDLVLSDGVGKGKTILNAVTVKKNTILRGGKRLVVKGKSKLSQVIISEGAASPTVQIQGNAQVGTIQIRASGTKINSKGMLSKVKVLASKVYLTDKKLDASQIQIAKGVTEVYLNGVLLQQTETEPTSETVNTWNPNKPYLGAVYINQARTKVFGYLNTNGKTIDESSVPAAGAFTVVSDGQVEATAQTVKFNKWMESDDRWKNYNIELTFASPLPESSGDLYLFYQRPDQNPVQYTEGEDAVMDSIATESSMNRIESAKPEVAGLYYSKAENEAGYYVSVALDRAVHFPQNRTGAAFVCSVDGSADEHIYGWCFSHTGHEMIFWLGLRQSIPSRVEIKRSDGQSIDDFAYDESASILAASDKKKEAEDLRINSVVFDVKSGELRITYKSETMPTSLRGSYTMQQAESYVLLSGGKEFTMTGQGSFTFNEQGEEIVVFGSDNIVASGITEADFRNGAQIRIREDALYESYGEGERQLKGDLVNLAGKPAISEYVTVAVSD